MKKFLKAVGILLGAVLVLLVGYLIYLFASYHRMPFGFLAGGGRTIVS